MSATEGERKFRSGGEQPTQRVEWLQWAKDIIQEVRGINTELTALIQRVKTADTPELQAEITNASLELYTRFATIKSEVLEFQELAVDQEIQGGENVEEQLGKVSRSIEMVQKTADLVSDIMPGRFENLGITEAPGPEKPANIFDTEVFTNLTELVQKYQAELVNSTSNPSDFDPRNEIAANEVPLLELQKLIQDAKEVLPERGSDAQLNQLRLQVIQSIITPAEKALEQLWNRVAQISDSEYSAWEHLTRTNSAAYQQAHAFPNENFAANNSVADLQSKIAEREAVTAQLNQEETGLVTTLNPSTSVDLRQAFPNQESDPLLKRQKEFWSEQKKRLAAEVAVIKAQIDFLDSKKKITNMLQVAQSGNLLINKESDNVSIAFEPIYEVVEQISNQKAVGRDREIVELRKQVLQIEFEQRTKAYFSAIAAIEDREIAPNVASDQDQHVHKARIFERMNSIIAVLDTLNEDPQLLDSMRKKLSELRKDNTNRMMEYYFWSTARKEVLLGSNGVRGITTGYNSSDNPLTGQMATEMLNDGGDLEGYVGANATLGQRTVKVHADVARGLKTDVAGSQVQQRAAREPGIVEVTYTETASGWVMRVLDDIYEKNYISYDKLSLSQKQQLEPAVLGLQEAQKRGLYLEIDGVFYRVPIGSDGRPVSGQTLHKEHGTVINWLTTIEKSRTNNNPRFDSNLVQRIFRLHLMTTWNHQALARGSTYGLSDSTYYAINWPEYARSEFKDGVANYSIFQTMFLLGYPGYSPWSMFSENAPAMVAEVLQEKGFFHEYEYLLYSFVSLVDTSTTKDPASGKQKPNFTVFAPPLKRKMVGIDPNGEPYRFQRTQNEGMIISLDDVRDVNGKRLYQLMPIENLGILADLYNDFGKNGIGFMSDILKKDVSKWDTATVINEMKKAGKYAMGLFPKIGLELEFLSTYRSGGDSSPGKQSYDIFMERIAVYLVMIQAVAMLLPHDIRGGGGKDFNEVSKFLVGERSRNTISKESEEVIKSVLEKLFRREVFFRELSERIEKQVENYLKFQA